MDDRQLGILIDMSEKVGNIDARTVRIERVIALDSKRLTMVENVAKEWARKHSTQLKVGSLVVALATAVGGVLGFLATVGKAVAG